MISLNSISVVCALVLGLIAGRTLAAAPALSPVVAAGDFRALPQLDSHHGVLNATLLAEQKDIIIGGVAIPALTFNGEYGGPVLRLAPGDRLRIRLINHTILPINLHFHGSHASPLDHGDNMHTVVSPGKSFDYRLTIPTTQPPGLYWYHTHIHGMSEEEVNRGLSGAMIIKGIDRRVPESAAARTRLLVLKTYSVEQSDDPNIKQLHGIVQSINGLAHSDIDAVAGATEFWRVGNQSPNDYYHLSIKGVKFRIVAIDGSPTTRDIVVDSLEIPPAGRMEAMITMPKAGRYALMSGSTPTGAGKGMKLSRELAAIQVTGDGGAGSDGPMVIINRAAATPDLRAAKLTASRTIVFSQKPGEEVYYIDGKTYDHMRVDLRVPLGSIEEWTIRNETDDMHVFHIHQVHFQVVAINGQAQPFDGVVDDVRVPERGAVTVRIPFTDPQIVGRFMYHCHVLKHEDRGMMANIEVYDPREDKSVTRPSHEQSMTMAPMSMP